MNSKENNQKTALIFSGGGSRGAYEVGVWRALEELNIKCDIVTGASIGSINGALYVQGTLKEAEELWKNINLNTVFPDNITYNSDPELVMNYLKSARRGGLEPSNLKNNLLNCLDLNKIYSSSIDYGLTTVKYPSMQLVELTKREIPRTKFIDYLIASSTVFPVFKIKEIEENKYIDGGFRKTMPIELAKRMGAQKFIIVDISSLNKIHIPIKKENIVYIKPQNNIGIPLVFDAKQARKNLKYGYNDTMKIYKKYLGKKYTFKDLNLTYQKTPEFPTITKYIDTLEYLGKVFNINDTVIYTNKKFNKILLTRIDKSSYDPDLKFKDLLNKTDQILYIYHYLKNPSPRKINNQIVKTFYKEYKAAYYLFKYLK